MKGLKRQGKKKYRVKKNKEEKKKKEEEEKKNKMRTGKQEIFCETVLYTGFLYRKRRADRTNLYSPC